ncbi:hypothetical protein DERP_000631 [Dermatophagoides pteronyssinus]|uniref:Gustatory receptor n=1 Tax=Dermatophagoides pteronyssinus TaxID=6956 RepID=A0ABQ8J0R5_DERPT|nr:hypothetical protein DERP_000631 [Dermatophagoides pteronyssinus]
MNEKQQKCNPTFLLSVLTEIFIERNQFNYRKKHLLIIALFTFTVARILICLISYYCHINIWQYDPLFNFFIFDHPHLFQRYSIILLCALLFGMECERKIFFTNVNKLTYKLPYELSLTNTEQCKQCWIEEKDKEIILNTYILKPSNKWFEFIIPIRLYRWYRRQSNKFDYYFHFKYVDQKKLSNFKLETIPNISIESRSFLMIINFIIQQLCFISHISLVLFSLFFFPYYYHSLLRIYHSQIFIHLFIWFDIFMFSVHFLVILHNAIILVIMVSITIIYQIFILKKINSSLRSLSLQSHRINNHPCINGIYRSSYNLNEQIMLIQLLHEHNRIVHYINVSSNDIYSKLFFRILILFLPSHILGVSALWNQLGLWYDKILISFIIFFEDFLLLPLYFIALQSKLLRCSEKNLTSIIYCIRRPLSFKIKYDNFFHCLTTEPYYGHSIANIGTITFRTMFNIMLSYVGLFIFILPKEYLLKG